MRRIGAETSVNDRYFYEEFGDKDGLLAATWETVRDDALAILVQAYAVRGANPSWEEMTQQVATTLLDWMAVDWMTVNPSSARIHRRAHQQVGRALQRSAPTAKLTSARRSGLHTKKPGPALAGPGFLVGQT